MAATHQSDQTTETQPPQRQHERPKVRAANNVHLRDEGTTAPDTETSKMLQAATWAMPTMPYIALHLLRVTR